PTTQFPSPIHRAPSQVRLRRSQSVELLRPSKREDFPIGPCRATCPPTRAAPPMIPMAIVFQTSLNTILEPIPLHQPARRRRVASRSNPVDRTTQPLYLSGARPPPESLRTCRCRAK